MLPTELFIADQIDEMEHRASMERQGDNISISFSSVAPDSIRIKSEQVESTTSDITPPTSNEKPFFGPRLDVKATNFDFQCARAQSISQCVDGGQLNVPPQQ